MFKKKDKNYDLEQLERQVYNLTKLIDINSIINSTLDIRKLLTIVMEIIKDIMDTEASTLLLFEEDTKNLVFKVALGEAGDELEEKYRVRIGQGIAGWVAEKRKPVIVNDAYNDERFDPDFDKCTGFKTKSILCTPLLFKGKLLGVIQAINPSSRPGFDEEDLNLFNVFANQAALAVQNAIFFHNALEEERIKSELISAKSIQKALIPHVNEKFKNVHITAQSVSAREIGGEFHGIFKIDDNHIGITLGDIHEKGVPGGLHASTIRGAVKALAGIKGRSPGDVVKNLNNHVLKDIAIHKNVSIFYGVVNMLEQTLQFVNFGTAYPMLVRNGVARYLRFGKNNLDDDTPTKKVIIKLQPGDYFVIITDGFLKLKNRNAKLLGLKTLMNFIEGSFDGPDSLIEKLMEFAHGFSDGLEMREDLSIITIKVD